jgi:cytochrome c2
MSGAARGEVVTDGEGKQRQRGVLSGVRERLSAMTVSAPWLKSRRFLAGAAAFAILIGLGGMVVGYAAAKSGVLHDLRVAVINPAVASVRHAMGARDESAWELYETQLGNFEMVRLPVADREGVVMASLEEMDGHLVFLTQAGRLSTLSPDYVLRDLNINVPMHTEEARAANIPNMNFDHFRALDLLAVRTGEHAFDLYASYNRYRAERQCFDIVVGRMRISTADGLAPQSGWEEIYATTPCVPPRTAVSQFASAFVGIQSGGRLVLRDAQTILFSVGDLEFDGVMYPGLDEAPNGPQDPTWDLGKVLEIDIASGRARHFAMGFRNPQGLLVDSSGRVWETEHGPYGGDEINLIHRDGNYGWPNVTYGMMYIPLRENWPLNPTRGGHEGYDRPDHVFVPSIGISQLIQPSADEFPFWGSALLLTSLRGRALYVLRLDGDHIVWAEPLPMGERLRDIINRANGDVAILTDAGNLVLMRALPEGDLDAPISITDARGRAAPESAAAEGQRLFAGNCQSCHSVTGQAGAGPALNGVVGRDIAATEFNYSPALRDAHGAWTAQRLTNLLTDEDGAYPGSTMPPPHLSREEAREIVAYLRTTEAH